MAKGLSFLLVSGLVGMVLIGLLVDDSRFWLVGFDAMAAFVAFCFAGDEFRRRANRSGLVGSYLVLGVTIMMLSVISIAAKLSPLLTWSNLALSLVALGLAFVMARQEEIQEVKHEFEYRKSA